jgi:hypothetical protein
VFKEIINRAVEEHPNDAQAALRWAMAFLDQHPNIKAELGELLLEQGLRDDLAMHRELNEISQQHRQPRQPAPPEGS